MKMISFSMIRDFLRKNLSLIAFLVLVFALRWSFADQYLVPSGSMEPTLQIGDRILVNKMAYALKIPYTSLIVARTGEPERGDIVVFENPRDQVTMVKRLIGMPGDKLVVDDGFVTINGEPIRGSVEGQKLFVQSDGSALTYQEYFGDRVFSVQRMPFMVRPQHFEMDVPADHYFAMGDNRDNSSDSRVWGFIPRDHLKGRAFAVFWSMRFEEWVPRVDWQRTGYKLN
jgi:signal peptidase I